MRRLLLIAVALGVGTSGPAEAHHKWLRLISPHVCGDAAILVVSYGHELPFGDSPPTVEDFSELRVVAPDGHKRPIRCLVPLGRPATAAVDLPAPGLWCAEGWSEHYGCRTTEGYKRGRRQEVEAQGFTVVECKHTFRYAKAYARAGSGGVTGTYQVGHGVEIVPDASIADLQAGATLGLVVLVDGEPGAGMVLSAAREGSCEELAHPVERDKFSVSGTTDEKGHVSLRLQEGGWWFLIAEEVVENPEPGVDHLYRSATLTVMGMT